MSTLAWIAPALLVGSGLPLVPERGARWVLAAFAAALLGVGVFLPVGAVPIEGLVPLREGYEVENLGGVLHRVMTLPWLSALRGEGPVGDLRAGVPEQGLMIGLTLLTLGAAFGRWAGLGTLRGVGLVALLVALGWRPVLDAALSGSAGAAVGLGWSLGLVGAGWSARPGLPSRLVGVGALGVGAAFGAVGRPEVAALAAAAAPWALLALVPGLATRVDAAWLTAWGRLRGLAPVAGFVGLTVGGALVASVGASLGVEAAPFLAPLRAAPWAGDALGGWRMLTLPGLGPVVGLGLVPLGLIVATSRPVMALPAVALVGLGRVLWLASHDGEAPYEAWRYLLVVWAPVLTFALLGAAVALRGVARWPSAVVPVALGGLVAAALIGRPEPIRTSQQEAARLVLAAVDAHPECTFLTRVVDGSQGPPPEDGHRPEAYRWAWARFGRGVDGLAVAPDLAELERRARGPDGAPAPKGCELVYVGLDCHLVGATGCGGLPRRGRELASFVGPSVPFNHHAGTWVPALHLVVLDPSP